MGRKFDEKGWLYEYEKGKKYRKSYDYELTDVRYVLGQQINPKIKKALICIGINPSMAMPNYLDPTLKRVQKYAKRKKNEYGAWYMLNVYPQRATKPKDMHLDDDFSMEIHSNNLRAIESLLSTIEDADVWCAWGAIIDDKKRTFLSDCLYGNSEKEIKGIISLFNGDYNFKAYGVSRKEYPRHPLVIKDGDQLKGLEEVGLKTISDKINNTIKK